MKLTAYRIPASQSEKPSEQMRSTQDKAGYIINQLLKAVCFSDAGYLYTSESCFIQFAFMILGLFLRARLPHVSPPLQEED